MLVSVPEAALISRVTGGVRVFGGAMAPIALLQQCGVVTKSVFNTDIANCHGRYLIDNSVFSAHSWANMDLAQLLNSKPAKVGTKKRPAAASKARAGGRVLKPCQKAKGQRLKLCRKRPAAALQKGATQGEDDVRVVLWLVLFGNNSGHSLVSSDANTKEH